MRSDRLLILSVLCLGFGLGLILGYCTGHTNFTAAYPFTGTVLHVDFTTVGPGVLGGLALTAIGALLLVWSFLAAIVAQFRGLGDPEVSTERLLD